MFLSYPRKYKVVVSVLLQFLFLIQINYQNIAYAQDYLLNNAVSQSKSYGAPSIHEVDYASGNITLNESLLGVAGYGYSLKYNSEGVEKKSKTWNQELGTSIVGLGWQDNENRIIRKTKQTAHTHDDSYVLNMGGQVEELVYTGKERTGSFVKTYRSKSHPYWKIEHHTQSDEWVIVKADGNKCYYGEGQGADKLTDHASNATEYNAVWDNWIGSSVVSPTDSLSISWHLSVQENIYGEQVKLYYDQEKEHIGSSTYTHSRAIYLSKVEGTRGKYLEFIYGVKESEEYSDPHIENSRSTNSAVVQPEGNDDRDAYQERYERNYLKEVVLHNYDQSIDKKVTLGYRFLNTKLNLKKRLLTSITYLNSNGELIKPSVTFSYFGENTSDGVYAGMTYDTTKLYNEVNGALLGGLKTYQTSTGSVHGYQYGKQELENSTRTIDVPFPADYTIENSEGNNENVGWFAPLLFFGNNYVVAIHEAMTFQAKVSHVSVYTWTGDHWQEKDLGIFNGYFHDNYPLEDSYTPSTLTNVKNVVLKQMGKIPVIGGVINGFKDSFSDLVANGKKAGEGAANGDPNALTNNFQLNFITDFSRDIVNNIASSIDKGILLGEHLFGISDPVLEEEQAYKEYKEYIGKNPRQEYHILLKEDYFSLLSTEITHTSEGKTSNTAVYAFRKDEQVLGEWTQDAFPVQVSSRYIDFSGGDKFFAVLDQVTDVFQTYVWDGYNWVFKVGEV